MDLKNCDQKICEWIYQTNKTQPHFEVEEYLQIVPLWSPQTADFLVKFGNLKRKLLLHATPLYNRSDIESQGLIKQQGVRNCGSLYSESIHFHDTVQGLFQYARPCANNNMVLLYVCDVAVGQPLVTRKQHKHDFTKEQLGEKFQSFFIEGFGGPVETEIPDWELNGASAFYKTIKQSYKGYHIGDYRNCQAYYEYAVVDSKQIDLKFRVVLTVRPTFRHRCRCFDNYGDFAEMMSRKKNRFG